MYLYISIYIGFEFKYHYFKNFGCFVKKLSFFHCHPIIRIFVYPDRYVPVPINPDNLRSTVYNPGGKRVM